MAQLMSVVKERDLAKDALMKWEEKERTHEAALNAIEKELNLEKQAVELHKKTVSMLKWITFSKYVRIHLGEGLVQYRSLSTVSGYRSVL